MPQPHWLNDDVRQQALQIIATAHEDAETAAEVLFESLSHLEASTITAEKTLFDRIKHSRDKTGLVLPGLAAATDIQVFRFICQQTRDKRVPPDRSSYAGEILASSHLILHASIIALDGRWRRTVRIQLFWP